MELDALELRIKADAKDAVSALDRLCSSLDTLDKSLSGISGISLTSLSQGVKGLTQAMADLNASGVKTQDFTRLKTNLENISKLSTSNFANLATAMNQITQSLDNFGNSAQKADAVKSVALALNAFGSVKIERALQNIPNLTREIRNMVIELSKLPNVNRNVITLINSVANLASNGSKVGSAARGMTSAFSRYNTTIRGSASHTFSLASALGKFYATYFLAIRGIKSLWKTIGSSMDYVETFNFWNVTMDKMGTSFAERQESNGEQSAEAYADGFRNKLKSLSEKMTGYTFDDNGVLSQATTKNLGLDPNALMNFQARIGSITDSVGMLGDASNIAQNALSMLSADLSSFTNTDLSTVMDNLASGMVGMSRTLYRYGIDITQTTLQEKAATLGIEKKVSAMSQEEKMQLRLIQILDSSKIAWGDQANTINSVNLVAA